MGQAKRRTTKIRHKTVGGGIFCCFENFDKCRPEVADDVISSVPVDSIGMDVLVKFALILHKTGAYLFDSLLVDPVLRTYTRYSTNIIIIIY